MHVRFVLVRFQEASYINTPDIFPPGKTSVILLFLLADKYVLGIVLARIFV